MELLLAAIALQVLAGTAALVFSRSPHLATIVAVGGMVLGCAAGLVPTIGVLLGGSPLSLRLTWDEAHGPFLVQVDALSAFFLVPVLGLSALAAVYGGDYLLGYRARKSLGIPWFFFNLFVAGMAAVLIARIAVLFLIAWEVMSASAFFLVVFEQERAEVRRAGWIFLIATHLGLAFLILGFLLLGRNAGNLEFAAFSQAPVPEGLYAGAIFIAALIGFGTKAGLVPLHVWLPEAHPVAPSHVSAVMSGVMIKLGFYGLLRILTFLGEPARWWGPTLAGLGLLSCVVGIALAGLQRDIKRVLAYSSIENMGLVALALGVGMWGWATGSPAVAVLGMTAGLLHIWNHSLMKGLMFLSAGSVLHATHTRDMEQLGGLMKRMPWTATMMMVGAVAIATLPPLNGFTSKWLIYMGLLQCGMDEPNSRSLPALFSVAVLAAVGGLAALCFVRLTGIVLLGSPRNEDAGRAHESSPWLLAPMICLAAMCLGAAIIPGVVTGWLAAVLNQVPGREVMAAAAPMTAPASTLAVIGAVNAVTLALIALGLIGLKAWSRRCTTQPTWGCGYARPTPRMQYTGRSFAELLSVRLLPRGLRPRTTRRLPRGLFPEPGVFIAATPDPVSENIYEPFFHRCAVRLSGLRIVQQGDVNIYLLYIAAAVVLALTWVSIRHWWVAS